MVFIKLSRLKRFGLGSVARPSERPSFLIPRLIQMRTSSQCYKTFFGGNLEKLDFRLS